MIIINVLIKPLKYNFALNISWQLVIFVALYKIFMQNDIL